MKTIYDKLDPKIKESIKEDLEKYPASTGALVASLQRYTFWSELRMQDVSTIINHSHLSLIELSQKDIIWGDRSLIDEEKTNNS